MATYTSHYNLTKPEGTERVNIGIINQNMDSIDAQMYKNAQSIIANHGGMAIPSNNNTHAAVSSGQYVYVYNHSSLAEGMYIAKSAISTNGALSLSNLTAVSNGGLNHVYSTLNSKFAIVSSGSMRDINSSGVYYLTSAVTDKPVMVNGYGGAYIVAYANSETLSGTFISTYDDSIWAIKCLQGVWTYTDLGVSQINLTFDTGVAGSMYAVGKSAVLTFSIGSRAMPSREWVTIATLPSGPAPVSTVYFSLTDRNGKPLLGRVAGHYAQVYSANGDSIADAYASVPMVLS